MRSCRTTLLLIVLILLVPACTTLAAAAPLCKIAAAVFPADSSPYGLTYGEWSAEWWQWYLSIPAGVNPANDETGEFAAIKQAGPVWFLAGANTSDPVSRSIIVPAGKALFVPIMTGEASVAEGNGTTEAELKDFAVTNYGDMMDNVSITIDGKTLAGIDAPFGSSRRYSSGALSHRTPSRCSPRT